MSSLRLVIPRVPKSPNSLRYRHWRVVKRDKDDWFEQVWASYMDKRLQPDATWGQRIKRRVSIVIHSPYQKWDRDNRWSAIKPLVDAIVKCGLAVDDCDEWMDLQEPKQVKSTKKEMRTEIEIQAI